MGKSVCCVPGICCCVPRTICCVCRYGPPYPRVLSVNRIAIRILRDKNNNNKARPVAGGGAGGARAPPEIFRLELNSATKVDFYWAACAPSHKMGFRSSVSKSGHPGEGRHEGLVPRNDVFTNGFMSFSCTQPCTDTFCTLSALPLKNPRGVANLNKAICLVRSDSTMGVTL